MTKKYYQLMRLVSQFYDIQKQYRVKHEFHELLKERFNSRKHIELADLLIRQMTLLNRVYRMKEGSTYLSEQEDLVLALSLLCAELKAETFINAKTQMSYHELLRVLGHDRVFKAFDVMRITRYSRTQSHYLIKRLQQCQRLKRVGGCKRFGYYYQLL